MPVSATNRVSAAAHAGRQSPALIARYFETTLQWTLRSLPALLGVILRVVLVAPIVGPTPSAAAASPAAQPVVIVPISPVSLRPITAEGSDTIQAIAVAEGYRNSVVAKQGYTID